MYTDFDCISMAKNNSDISVYEIDNDIHDTIKDIEGEKARLWSYGWKLDSSYNKRIKEMEEFVEKLNALKRWKKLLQEIEIQ